MRAQMRYLPQWYNFFGGLADKGGGLCSSDGSTGHIRVHAA